MPTWKDAERAIAARLNGKRTGNTGRNTEDVEHDRLSIECKHRRELPKWLHRAVEQAVRNAPAGKIPMAILHQHRQPYENSYAVIRLQDLVKLME